VYQPKIGRIPVLDLSPEVDAGTWPAKGFVGEVIPFAATVFREGHDMIGADLLLTDPAGVETEHRMSLLQPGTDRWGVCVAVGLQGRWQFRVRSWADDFATWMHAAGVKIPVGLDTELVFASGAELLLRAASEKHRPQPARRRLKTAASALTDPTVAAENRLRLVDDERIASELTMRPLRSLVTESVEREILVERERAGVASWYEFFPRSEGAKRRKDGTWVSGTLRTAAQRLPAVAAMGFDVIYLPPIHPIGVTGRKGPNNSLDAGEGDPGSPWAIGAAAGGHDTIHPDLGTEKDLTYFLGRAKAAGMEVALDLALQASPDHPWVAEHPEWFTTLPDGSIAYAENPPKKYQDIYPINFDNDPVGLRAEVLRILEHWIALGVNTFRVDNPHTKPIAFWEWLIHTVNDAHPDVVFLAEAFTRPALMRTLAKVGFQQSYSYFTWRNTREELEEFLASISAATADYLRPNLFVNTPDILTEYLQFGGPAAFKVRAAVAATAAPLWGVYAGFELQENVARSGAEEYIDNEKYQYRPRDFAAAEAAGRSLAPYLTMLNEARRAHPALRQLRNLHLHSSDDEAILVYSKHLSAAFAPDGRDDTVIVVANVDPHSVRETIVHLDVTRLGVQPGALFDVVDLVTGARWRWGADDYVRLDAFTDPVHILTVETTDR